MSINRAMDKQTVIHPHDEIPFNKKGCTNIHDNMDQSPKWHAE